MSFHCDRLCQSAVTQYVIPWPPLVSLSCYSVCHSLISTRESITACVSPQGLNMSFPGLTRESLRATDCRVKPDNDSLSRIAVAIHNNVRPGKWPGR